MQSTFPIFFLLTKPRYFIVFLVIGGLFFYANYYVMAYFPGTNGYACLPGANLTPLNIVFSLLVSALTALAIVGMAELFYRHSAARAAGAGSASAFGALTGVLTAFCTLCTLPAISLFGLSISLIAFTEHALLFKGFSLILLALAVFSINRQLQGICPAWLGYFTRPVRAVKTLLNRR